MQTEALGDDLGMDAIDGEDPFADVPVYEVDARQPDDECDPDDLETTSETGDDEGVEEFQESGSPTEAESTSSEDVLSSDSQPFSEYGEDLSDAESESSGDLDSCGDEYSFADQRRPKLTRLQSNWHLSFRECCNQFDLSSRDWNEEFQCLMEEAEHGVNCDIAPKRRLQILLNDYDELTRNVVRKFVDKTLSQSTDQRAPVNQASSGISGTGIFPVKDIGLVPLRLPSRLKGVSSGKQSPGSPALRLQDVRTISQLRKWRKERMAQSEDTRRKLKICEDSRKTKPDPSNSFETRNFQLQRCFRLGNIFLQKWITEREVICARTIQATFRALLVSRVNGFHFPLCATHTYRGVTITAMGLIPIGRSAKTLHGVGIQPDVPLYAASHQLIRVVGMSVNLMPYNVGLRQLKVPGVEVVEAPDTRMYFINAVGLLPPLFDDVGNLVKRRLEHVTKSPLLAAYMHSPDHAYERSCDKLSKLLPKVVKNILFSPEGASNVLASNLAAEQAEALATGRAFAQTTTGGSLSQRAVQSLLQTQIVKLFHSLGVNLCLMGEVLRSFLSNSNDSDDVSKAASTSLCVEMISRTAKRFFYRELHRSVVFMPNCDPNDRAKDQSQVRKDYGNSNLHQILSRLIGALFPRAPSVFIDDFICEVGRKFGFDSNESGDPALIAVRATLCEAELRSTIIRRICEVCGISLASGAIQKVIQFSNPNNYSVSYASLSRSESTAHYMDSAKDALSSPEYIISYVLPNRIRLNCQRGEYSAALKDAQRVLSACQKSAHVAPEGEQSKLVVSHDGVDAHVIQWLLCVATIMGLHLKRYDEAVALLDEGIRVVAELGKRSEEIAHATAVTDVQHSARKTKTRAASHRITLFIRLSVQIRNCQGRLMQGKGDLQRARGYFFEGLRIAKEKLPKESLSFASALILGGLRGLLDVAQTPIGALLIDIKFLQNNTIAPFLSQMRPSSFTHALLEQSGSALLHAGELQIASECLEQAANQSRIVFGGESQEFATDLNLWAFALMRSDIQRFGPRCELLMTQAMLLIEKISGSYSVNHLTAINNLGALQIALRRYVRASRLFHEAYAMCSQNVDEDPTNLLDRNRVMWETLEADIVSLRGERPLFGQGSSPRQRVGLDHPVARQIEDNLMLLRKNFRPEAILVIQRRWRECLGRRRLKGALLQVSLLLQRVGRAFIRREAVVAPLHERGKFPFCFGLSRRLLLASADFVLKCDGMERNWNSDLQHVLGNVGSYCGYQVDGFGARRAALRKLDTEFTQAGLDVVLNRESSSIYAPETLNGHHRNIVITHLGHGEMAEHLACQITHLYRIIIHSDIPFIAAPITVALRSPKTGEIYLCQSVLPLSKQVEFALVEGSSDLAEAVLGERQISRQGKGGESTQTTPDILLTSLKHFYLFLNGDGDSIRAMDGPDGLCLPRYTDGSFFRPQFSDESLRRVVGTVEVVLGADGRFYLTNPLGLMPMWWRTFEERVHCFRFTDFSDVTGSAIGISIDKQRIDSLGPPALVEHILVQGIYSSTMLVLEDSGVFFTTPFSWLQSLARRGLNARHQCEQWLSALPEVHAGYDINAEFLIFQKNLGELLLESDSLQEGIRLLRRVIGFCMRRRTFICYGIRTLDFVARACIRLKESQCARHIYLDALLACDHLCLTSLVTYRGDLLLIPLVGLLQCSESDGVSMFGVTSSKIDTRRCLTTTRLFSLVQTIREKSWLSGRIVAVFHEFTKYLLKQKLFEVSSAVSGETCRSAMKVHGYFSMQHVKALTTESQVYFSWDPKLFAKECREPLEIAVSILEKIAPESQQLGSIRNNLGFLLMQQRNYFAARVQYRKAEEILRNCLEKSASDPASAREITKIRRNIAAVNSRITSQCATKIQAISRGWLVRRSKLHVESESNPKKVFQDKQRQEKYRLAAVEERDRMLVVARMEVEFERLISRAAGERQTIVLRAQASEIGDLSARWLNQVKATCFESYDRWWLEDVSEPTQRMFLVTSGYASRALILAAGIANKEKIERRLIEREVSRAWRTGTIFVPNNDIESAARAFSSFLKSRYKFELELMFKSWIIAHLSSVFMLERLLRKNIIAIEASARELNFSRATEFLGFSPPRFGSARSRFVRRKVEAREKVPLPDVLQEELPDPTRLELSLAGCVVYERCTDHENLPIPFQPIPGKIHWVLTHELVPLDRNPPRPEKK